MFKINVKIEHVLSRTIIAHLGDGAAMVVYWSGIPVTLLLYTWGSWIKIKLGLISLHVCSKWAVAALDLAKLICNISNLVVLSYLIQQNYYIHVIYIYVHPLFLIFYIQNIHCIHLCSREGILCVPSDATHGTLRIHKSALQSGAEHPHGVWHKLGTAYPQDEPHDTAPSCDCLRSWRSIRIQMYKISLCDHNWNSGNI